MNGEFENKVVIISGATGGLVQEAARQFAAQGAHLALISNDRSLLAQMEQELMLDSERLLTQEVDLLQSKNADRVADEIISRFGRADILLHLVGGWIGGKSVMEVDRQEISQILDQHTQSLPKTRWRVQYRSVTLQMTEKPESGVGFQARIGSKVS